jgi:hypothetical protein
MSFKYLSACAGALFNNFPFYLRPTAAEDGAMVYINVGFDGWLSA